MWEKERLRREMLSVTALPIEIVFERSGNRGRQKSIEQGMSKLYGEVKLHEDPGRVEGAVAPMPVRYCKSPPPAGVSEVVTRSFPKSFGVRQGNATRPWSICDCMLSRTPNT